MPESSAHFVTTLPLCTTPQQEKILRVRMRAAHSAYNALLGECLRRCRLMRESRAWRAAREIPAGKERSATYRNLNKLFGFQEYDLYQFIRTLRAGVPFHPAEPPAQVAARTTGRVGFIGKHLDSHTVMAMGKRAFRTVERAIFKGGRVRFCRKDEFGSVEGIGPKSPLGWSGSHVQWRGLSIPAIIDHDDPVIRHGLESHPRLTRILRQTIRGRERYYVQLVCEGMPCCKGKHKPAEGIVGLDIGPSTIAIVGEKSASLETFCGRLANRHRQIRRLQRQADRQRRANNPGNYNPNGTYKPRPQRHPWRVSNRMRRVRNEAAELARREAAHRKNLHGQLAHRVLAQGDDVRTEKLSYRSFQRNFGKSVKFHAPGMFVVRLRAEAKKWGATVTEFGTRRTMLSQTCVCGQIRKKKLSERQHECACGCNAQRDQLSAFLARHVAGDKLDVASAQKAWRGACNPLRVASSKTNGSTDGVSARVHLQPNAGREPSHANNRPNPVSAVDVVAGRKVRARATEKPGEVDSRTSTGYHQLPVCGRCKPCPAALLPDHLSFPQNARFSRLPALRPPL